MKDNWDKKWDIHKVVQEAIKSSHNEPSPETKERLVALEINLNNMMEKLEQSIQDNKEAHSAIMDSIKSFEEKLDIAIGKKADKWVEKVLIWAGMTIGAGVLTLVVRWVILLELQ